MGAQGIITKIRPTTLMLLTLLAIVTAAQLPLHANTSSLSELPSRRSLIINSLLKSGFGAFLDKINMAPEDMMKIAASVMAEDGCFEATQSLDIGDLGSSCMPSEISLDVSAVMQKALASCFRYARGYFMQVFGLQQSACSTSSGKITLLCPGPDEHSPSFEDKINYYKCSVLKRLVSISATTFFAVACLCIFLPILIVYFCVCQRKKSRHGNDDDDAAQQTLEYL